MTSSQIDVGQYNSRVYSTEVIYRGSDQDYYPRDEKTRLAAQERPEAAERERESQHQQLTKHFYILRGELRTYFNKPRVFMCLNELSFMMSYDEVIKLVIVW